MPEFSIEPTPHTDAVAIISGKPVVSRRVFDAMLPELKSRAFTVAGVEGANVLQRIRDLIADLPQGRNWEDVRSDLINDLEPYLGEAGADRRSTLLLRTHGFQAFQSANYQTAQADDDTTHLQYLATEDENVRDSHLALNGIILPKDDLFWDSHMPPWEWGCRCRVRPINPDLLDMARDQDTNRAPDDKLVMEGPALERLRDGQLQRDGRTYNVTAPSEAGREGAFQWSPRTLRIPIGELRDRWDDETFRAFEQFARSTPIDGGRTLWDWLS